VQQACTYIVNQEGKVSSGDSGVVTNSRRSIHVEAAPVCNLSVFLLMTVFSQSFFSLMCCDLMSFSFLTTRHT